MSNTNRRTSRRRAFSLLGGAKLTAAQYGATGFACQTQADDCDSRADCPKYATDTGHWMCAYDGKHRYCLNELASCY